MLSTAHNVMAAALLLAAISRAAGDIRAYSSDGRRRDFAGSEVNPAPFGHAPPVDGLKAFLVDARPGSTCKPLDPPPSHGCGGRSGNFAILVARSDGCSHATQVLAAQRAGYVAAILHGSEPDSWEELDDWLDHPGGLTWELIRIPSVSVSEETADSLRRDYTDDKGGHVVLVPSDRQIAAARYKRIFLFILVSLPVIPVLGFIVLVVPFSLWLHCRDARRAAVPAEKRLCRYEAGGPCDTCPICLEEYGEGEELRVLPCSHTYHDACLEPWLTGAEKTTCPLCGRDVANREAEPGAAFP